MDSFVFAPGYLWRSSLSCPSLMPSSAPGMAGGNDASMDLGSNGHGVVLFQVNNTEGIPKCSLHIATKASTLLNKRY